MISVAAHMWQLEAVGDLPYQRLKIAPVLQILWRLMLHTSVDSHTELVPIAQYNASVFQLLRTEGMTVLHF